MTGNAEEITGISIDVLESIKEFFTQKGGYLTLACREIGLDYQNTRNNINGPAVKITLVNALILNRWQIMWITQEAARKELAEQYRKLKGIPE